VLVYIDVKDKETTKPFLYYKHVEKPEQLLVKPVAEPERI
jgi:hypothetical protein